MITTAIFREGQAPPLQTFYIILPLNILWYSWYIVFYLLIQFNTVTIIFSFRRGEVLCVLVWFRVLRNFVHTHLRHPCLACPARRIDCYNFCHHYNLFFIPRTALIPGSLAKGSWLAARLVYFKYSYIQRHLHRTNYTNLICRQDWGIACTEPYRFHQHLRWQSLSHSARKLSSISTHL